MHGGHLVVAPATNIMTITDITDREAALQRENERLLNTIRVQAAAIEELRSAHDVALQGWKCECSTDDACRFAKERDAFKADAERYRWMVSQIVSDNFDRLESAFARFGDDAMACTADEFNAVIDAEMKETK